ncbi:MAG: hypothetical protein KGZ49_04285 [Syntrophaceae bacterium]|nr:hypothetical protein [Syntrophaceae bacterium]
MQMKPEFEFEFSRDGLIAMLKTAVAPYVLNDEVIEDIEKKLPFTLINRYVKKGIVEEGQVFEIVKKFANSIIEIESRETYPGYRYQIEKEITPEVAKMAFNNLVDECPFCLK